MFFVLSKILAVLTQPNFWLVVLFLVAYFSKRKKLKLWSKRLCVFGMFFFTNTVVFLEFARLWETEGATLEDVEHYDVGIVLGGMAQYDSNLKRLSLRRGGDRIWQAINLYKLGKIDKLLICGANGYLDSDEPLNEAIQFRDVLILQGIPKEDILLDSTSKNTYENALEAKKIVDRTEEIRDVLLITSGLHMRRSRACFGKVGFSDFSCFSTDHYTGAVRGYKWNQYLIPNFGVLLDWNRLTHEWFGYLMYDLVGYI